MEIAILIIVLLVLIVRIAIRYDPTLDLVVSKGKFTMLLWYTKYYDNDEKNRVYIKIF